MNGTGVTKDEAKAAILYKQAADQGYAHAQYSFGKCQFCERDNAV